ncbi:uncharacterized protein AB675_3500 [Cyphellophora attinorum]|uniref:NTF2-like domain-containing protein n=1 Tax=Cyphellophora attinorum TaxID=1664694 RepID=A0A0N1HPJ5_9EURO|nr:uncharacterized protein AB675_3500 [Phialophora attinorum]KPI39672.1 hypothetical protein AB675_3500 [Phialophora attinorum]
MKLLPTLTTLLLALTSTAIASALPPHSDETNSYPSPKYPSPPNKDHHNCLTTEQATSIVATFSSFLTNPNRTATAEIAQALLAEGYVEESDSINYLAGYPLGSQSFTGKEAYISDLSTAPPIPSFETLEILHTCNQIIWRWNIPHLALDKYPVKGIQVLYVNDPKSGQVNKAVLEFSSIAWGGDIGWVCTPPTGKQPVMASWVVDLGEYRCWCGR